MTHLSPNASFFVPGGPTIQKSADGTTFTIAYRMCSDHLFHHSMFFSEDSIHQNMADTKELAKIRRRRGVAKGSITRIETRLHELEGESDQPNTRDTSCW